MARKVLEGANVEKGGERREEGSGKRRKIKYPSLASFSNLV